MIISPSKSLALTLIASALIHATQAHATLVAYQPNPADLNDLDHHSAYTWRIDNINLNGGHIESATLTFKDIANWDANPNVLHLWLLDTAKNAGVASFIDDRTNSGPVTDLTDDFGNPRFHSDPNWLVASGTSKTFLTDKSFSMNPSTYTFSFNAAQLDMLRQYIASGNNFAFGLDPDCHFWNNGVTFAMNITPVPEMATLFPLVGLLVAITSTHILRRRKMQRLASSSID